MEIPTPRANQNVNTKDYFKSLVDRFDLEVINSQIDEKKLLKFKTVQEAENYLTQIESLSVKSYSMEGQTPVSNPPKFSEDITTMYMESTKHNHFTMQLTSYTPCQLFVTFISHFYNSYNDCRITRLEHPVVELIGSTIGVLGWKTTQANASIASSKHAHVQISGILQVGIFIENVAQVVVYNAPFYGTRYVYAVDCGNLNGIPF
ncbi:MAG: hypothetical protein ACK4GN_01490 [Runella sp.]